MATSPGRKLTEIEFAIALPFNTPVILAKPVVVPDVNVAVNVPLLLSITSDKAPKVELRETTPLLRVRLFPFTSFS